MKTEGQISNSAQASRAFCVTLVQFSTLFFTVVHPALANSMQMEETMKKVLWLAAALLGIFVLAGGRWIMNVREADARRIEAAMAAAKANEQLATARTEQGQREYVLEVINLGVSFEKYRQGRLWDALQTGSASTSLREQDPKKYPWADNDKRGMAGSRIGDALLNGAGYSVVDWGTPVFNASPPNNSAVPDGPLSPHLGVAANTDGEGMATSLFVAAACRSAERPDRLLDDVFDFFDRHPDVPYIVLNSDDGMTRREDFQATGTSSLVKDGYYVPEMPDVATLLILARRERVDTIRPYAFEDIDDYRTPMDILNRDGVSRRLFLGYLDLEKSLPRSDGKKIGRTPTAPEWLDYAARFSVRADIRGTGPTSFYDREFNAKHRPALDWKPTPWFPVPWSKSQLKMFDDMSSRGFVHRPVFVNTSDEHGKPLKRSDAREKALMEGLRKALLTLPEEERAKGPVRVIAATNNQTNQMIALESVLRQYAEEGGPEIDSSRIDQFINIDRRLGNTGAATLFMQMAIGVLGSYRAGGLSLAVNLRDPAEATFIFISPPAGELTEERRQGMVFKPVGSLPVDPANYEVPATQ